MKKILLTLTLALTSLVGFSQFIHHSVDECLTLSVTGSATYTASVANPNSQDPAGDPNTSTNVSSSLSAGSNNNLIFTLPTSYSVGDAFTFNFRYYSSSAGANNSGSGRVVVRMYNSTLGAGGTSRINLPVANKTGGQWEDYSFSTASLDDNSAGTMGTTTGYDRIQLIPSNNNDNLIETFYFDDVEFNVEVDNAVLADDTADLETGNSWMYDHSPENFNATISETGGATFLENQASPSLSGNSSPTVLKITRGDDNANSGIKLSGGDFDHTAGNLTFRIYPECNLAAGSNVRIRMRKDSDNVTQQSFDITPLVGNQWNEVTIDLTSGTGSSTTPDNIYNEFVFLFNQGDATSASNGTIFYIDAVQAPEQLPLSTESFELANSVKLLKNPVSNTLQFSKSPDTAAVYSITGQQVMKFDSMEEGYDVSTLKSGLYLIEVTFGSASKVFKFIKE
ncbi:T9SS type A sorting domain-containing protein [Lacinutrix himadriensis]|uniref:T9SS type A sorting domain-containing protein n=1 Tax=Lacinutrix himadriensis TaxID=641549 RepID=UPI0006E2E924|nr:T9SS type A sorting domain-containing protein [Lacinutrix himadriensis]